MWKFLSVICFCFNLVYAYRHESFVLPDIMKIFEPPSWEGVSEICEKHLNYIITGVQEGQLWALKMMDSITKFPDGVLMGHLSIPGHFDECVNVTHKEFVGQHCMAKLKIESDPETENLFLPSSYSRAIQNIPLQLTYGLCLPSTCNSSDIKALFNNLPIDSIKLDLNDTNCSTKEFRPFRTEDWITVAVILVVLIVAMASTAYDLYQRKKLKNEKPSELWSAFSLYSNAKQLFSISQSTAQLKCLHGVRFFSMCWVILGHSYFTILLGAPMNIFEMPNFLRDKSFIPVSNAYVSVDSFFFLSGLLVCLVFFRDIVKKKSFDVPVAFIHRYLRLTPPFAILILIQGTIISRMGNGPFWIAGSDLTEQNCRESWWMGILYVQNYLKPGSMCLGQSWYLSADMQMFWLSPFILYPILLFPVIAPYFLILLTLIAAFTNFAITYVYELGPNLLMSFNKNRFNQFETEYAPFHTRMAPYIIGIATGYIICGIQAKKIRLNLSKLWVVIGWMACFSILGASLFGIAPFMNDSRSQTESSFYLSFHRVGWALGLAWLVIACVGGYGGPINDLLSWDYFQPLGKLAYCNFLIHMTLQNYRINSSRINQYARHFDIVYAYFGDLVISYLISVPICLLFEFPFTKLDRHFLQKLVIFPFPKPKEKVENGNCEKTVEKPVENLNKLEEGKINPTFTESS